jgi:cytochrome c1
MKMMSDLRWMALALVIGASTPVSSAVAQGLPPGLRACASEKDDAQRLSCYDREIARLDQSAAAPAPAAKAEATTAAAAATAAAPPATAAAPDERFGYRGDIAREELDQKAANEGSERMEATITEVSSRPRGELVITLNNGQVWAQRTPDPKMRLKVGDQVTIKKASMGSFMLVAGGRSSRVTRVQ